MLIPSFSPLAWSKDISQAKYSLDCTALNSVSLVQKEKTPKIYIWVYLDADPKLFASRLVKGYISSILPLVWSQDEGQQRSNQTRQVRMTVGRGFVHHIDYC